MTFVLDNLVLLLLIGGGIVLLTLIQTWLAYTHDKVVANAGPIRESEEIRVEIEHREAKRSEAHRESRRAGTNRGLTKAKR
jgi:hypothetical protein